MTLTRCFSTVYVTAAFVSALAGAHPARCACGQRTALAAVARLTPVPSVAGVALLPRYARGISARPAPHKRVRLRVVQHQCITTVFALKVSGVKKRTGVSALPAHEWQKASMKVAQEGS